MGRTSWQASSSGSYWIDIVVGHLPLHLMVDTGLTDPRNELAFALEPGVYDQLRKSHQLSRFRTRISRDASGRYATVETAETPAQLFDPKTGQRVGPVVRLFVSRGASKVPSRVGVPFFHHLKDCRVEWNLAAQDWCIEYV